jgi:hypothetical protein
MDEARAALDGHVSAPRSSREVVLYSPAESRMGRPPLYNEELGLKVCAMVAKGASLVQVTDVPGMPSYRTLMRWIDTDEQFRTEYDHAKRFRMECLVSEILEIADDVAADTELKGPQGEQVLMPVKGSVERSKLQIKQRKWLMALESPSRFGNPEMPRAGRPQLPAPDNGDNAKEINPRGPMVIENDPLADALAACDRATKGATA